MGVDGLAAQVLPPFHFGTPTLENLLLQRAGKGKPSFSGSFPKKSSGMLESLRSGSPAGGGPGSNSLSLVGISFSRKNGSHMQGFSCLEVLLLPLALEKDTPETHIWRLASYPFFWMKGNPCSFCSATQFVPCGAPALVLGDNGAFQVEPDLDVSSSTAG